nr:ABC transporter ATP-binding protein [Leucobacter weissii]
MPRTIKRHASRRVVTGRIVSGEPASAAVIRPSGDASAEADLPEPADADPEPGAEVAAETDPVIEPEPEPVADPQPVAEPEPEPVAGPEPVAEPEPDPRTTPEYSGTGTESVVTAIQETAPPAPHPARDPEPAPAQPRPAERVEIPVPSVQRARERGVAAAANPIVLRTEELTKSYGDLLAAAEVSIAVHAGSFIGVVGPNGAGKTTVLSMISGLNRPTSGRVTVHGIDVWADGPKAKRLIGTLPDRLRLFDRLTGAQLLYYAGVLHGVEEAVLSTRARELAQAFGLESALERPVSDYSAGMQKKIGLACAMIHAPGVLVLDEPFEAIDPVSASNVTEILEKFVAGGGSVVMSSHSLDLIQRVCDHVAVIVDGAVIAQGTVDAVRGGVSLEERFRSLTRTEEAGKGLEWLHGS